MDIDTGEISLSEVDTLREAKSDATRPSYPLFRGGRVWRQRRATALSRNPIRHWTFLERNLRGIVEEGVRKLIRGYAGFDGVRSQILPQGGPRPRVTLSDVATGHSATIQAYITQTSDWDGIRPVYRYLFGPGDRPRPAIQPIRKRTCDADPDEGEKIPPGQNHEGPPGGSLN